LQRWVADEKRRRTVYRALRLPVAASGTACQDESMKKPSKTAWFNAAQSWDHHRVKEMLREHPEWLAATNPKGLNALHMACAVRPGTPGLHEENGIKTVTALLDAGIDIESVAFRDNDGGEWYANAVWFAVGSGQNLPLLRFLLKRGGDPSYSLFSVLWGYKPEFQLDEIAPFREQYRKEMNCQIIHDSIHGRPGWTREYALVLGGALAGYGSVAVVGPWQEKPALYEFYVVPEHRMRIFDLFGSLLAVCGAKT
jgi:hypothetical protein